MIPGIAEDQSLFPVEKMDAHRRGVLHQAISVFVFDGDRLLIQKRADGKYHSGGLWANTCCSHPEYGETAEQCAARRLNEELGFTVPVTRRATVEYHADVGNGLWENERVAVFQGSADAGSLVVDPNPDEVSDTRWLTVPELRTDILANGASYTPWLRIYVKRWDELGLA
jgi:isopentenyl-diphosphate delta-isomerase